MMTEQECAEFEAARNSASDEYFKARPGLDKGDNRKIFEAGFKWAYELALLGKPMDAKTASVNGVEFDPIETDTLMALLSIKNNGHIDHIRKKLKEALYAPLQSIPSPRRDYSPFNLDLNTWRSSGRISGMRYYFESEEYAVQATEVIRKLLQDATK